MVEGKRGKSPSQEELEFIYRLIADGASDPEVLAKYAELQEQGKLGYMPARGLVRFVRQRRKELDAAKKVLADIGYMGDPILDDRRNEHFKEMAELAGDFASAWDIYQYSDPRVEYYGLIMKAEDIEGIDERLANGLVDHLKEQYKEEFKNVRKKEWTDLIGLKMNTKALNILYELEKVKFFEGRCDICRPWYARLDKDTKQRISDSSTIE